MNYDQLIWEACGSPQIPVQIGFFTRWDKIEITLAHVMQYIQELDKDWIIAYADESLFYEHYRESIITDGTRVCKWPRKEPDFYLFRELKDIDKIAILNLILEIIERNGSSGAFDEDEYADIRGKIKEIL